MSTETPTPEELLSAYADGGLSSAEEARVERYLADNPAAAAEVNALRQTINATRAVQPRPAAEPPWAEMSATIRAEIGDAPRRSWWQRLKAALKPRYAVPAAVAALAAVVLFVVLRGTGGVTPDPGQSGTTVALAADPAGGPAADDPLELYDPLTGMPLDLELDELDLLLAELDTAAPEPEVDIDGGGDEDDGGMGDALFGDPTFTELFESLTEDELGALDAFLASQTG